MLSPRQLGGAQQLQQLGEVLAALPLEAAAQAQRAAALGTALRTLIAAGLDQIPLPAGGATLARWRMLAAVAARDVALVKLYEGHTDALAILAELDGPVAPAGSAWGVWAAEAPPARLQVRRRTQIGSTPEQLASGAEVVLDGVKAWCSGAASLDHALVSGWLDDGAPCLVALRLAQPGVRISADGWQAVGMAATDSVDVHFSGAVGTLVGAPRAYLERPGFWHGGIGIAACWHGAAAWLADYLRSNILQRSQQSSADDPLRLAQLGAADVALSAAAALLREAAAQLDAQPDAAASTLALRARLGVEAAATEVLQLAGRALGAAPLCRDLRCARMVADLPVFLRQSHAERDLAALGRQSIRTEPAWIL